MGFEGRVDEFFRWSDSSKPSWLGNSRVSGSGNFRARVLQVSGVEGYRLRRLPTLKHEGREIFPARKHVVGQQPCAGVEHSHHMALIAGSFCRPHWQEAGVCNRM